MLFTHKKCGGLVVLNLSKVIRLVTPSYAINLEGFTIGVAEPESCGQATPSTMFLCRKCLGDVSLDNLLGTCEICREQKPIPQLYTRREVNCICESCESALASNSSTDVSPRVLEARQWITFRKKTEKKSVASILNQPFSF